MFMLDTNTLIYFFKGLGGVATNLLSTPPQSIMIPSIVIYELEYGIVRSTMPEKRRAQLDDILIAACAIEAKATLVTNNTAEFSRVKGLSTCNWF